VLDFDAADNFSTAIDQQGYGSLHVLLSCWHLLRIENGGYDEGCLGSHLLVAQIDY